MNKKINECYSYFETYPLNIDQPKKKKRAKKVDVFAKPNAMRNFGEPSNQGN